MPEVPEGESVLDALSYRQRGRPAGFTPKAPDAPEQEPSQPSAVAPPVNEEAPPSPEIPPTVEIAPPEPTQSESDKELAELTAEELKRFEDDARKLVAQLLERGLTKGQIAAKLGQWKRIWLTSAARHRKLSAAS